MLTTPGMCKYCGCTAPETWLDAEHTRCSGCLDKLSESELSEYVTCELKLAGDNTITIELTAQDILQVVANLQLGLRHPLVKGTTSAQRAERAIDQWREMLVTELALAGLAEMIRRGADPRHDVIASEPIAAVKPPFRLN